MAYNKLRREIENYVNGGHYAWEHKEPNAVNPAVLLHRALNALGGPVSPPTPPEGRLRATETADGQTVLKTVATIPEHGLGAVETTEVISDEDYPLGERVGG